MVNPSVLDPMARTRNFCAQFGLRVPVLQAPMSGACPPQLAIAVSEAGGMGGCGVLLDNPSRIRQWADQFRAGSDGPFQLNNWIPDTVRDDSERVGNARDVLSRFGSAGPVRASKVRFDEQCAAMIDAEPTVISSIMGVFDADYVHLMAERGIKWIACAVTLREALAAQDAGADAIVAQGYEAGGHRGSFDPEAAQHNAIGLFALLPQLADSLRVPIIAAGGVADGRGMAAALALGASAVQIGTALLRCPETGIDKDWATPLSGLPAEHTILTRAYTGRLGRAVATPFVTEWDSDNTPPPASYPIQRQLVAQWRAGHTVGLERVNRWAGQSAALATEQPAADIVTRMWRNARKILE